MLSLCVADQASLKYIEVFSNHSIGIHHNITKMNNAETSADIRSRRNLDMGYKLGYVKKKRISYT